MSLKKQLKKLQAFFDFYCLEVKRKVLLKQLCKKEKIKIVFLGYALGGSCDIFSKLYSEFKKDKRFEPYIVIVPNTYGTETEMLELLHQAQNYLSSLQIPYICGYDEKNKSFFDAKEEINPDIVFMCHHYDWFRKEFRIDNYLDKLVYITPYAYNLENHLNYHINTKAYNLAHKCFFETKKLIELWKKEAKNKRNICNEFYGYLKLDYLLDSEKQKKDPWKIKNPDIKRIIWAPHHLDAPLSNFLEYKDLFLQLAHSNKKLQIAFRPHPGLKGSLKRIAKWSDEQVEHYWSEWEQADNGFVSEGSYNDLFFTSDAMILDSISFIAEYLATNRPYLIQEPKQKDFAFNSFTSNLLNILYKSTSWEDIERFIEVVVCQGQDSKKGERRKFFLENFISPYGRLAANNIYQAVCSEIFLLNQTRKGKKDA